MSRKLAIPILAAAVAVATAFLAACDPCSGVVGCQEGAHVSYRGRITGHFTNEGVPGVRVEFRRTGGIALERDTVSAVTGEGGRYLLSVPASERGTVEGEIVVTPPGSSTPYVVPGLRLATVEVRGDARDLPVWVADPYVDVFGMIYSRATRQFLGNTPGEFRRTGGLPFTPTPYRVSSDAGSGLRINVSSTTSGEIEGDLFVRPAGAPREYLVRHLRLPTRYDGEAGFNVPFIGFWGVGPWLGYTGQVVRADDGSPVAGAQVVFRRTGGIEVSPRESTTTTGAAGEFALQPVPLAEGTAEGELVVTAPGQPPVTITGIRMPTFEADEQRSLGTFPIPR
jgi:hypothetical protein